jgi:hypothetical protein
MCNCKNYTTLELYRDQISKRIKESRGIIKTLDLKAEVDNGVTVLFQCPVCGQFWQKSMAWNWGGKDYLFQIPQTNITEWLTEQFMSPSDMLIYSAQMTDYFSKNKFIDSTRRCKNNDCAGMAIEGSPLCKKHFVDNLQEVGLLPKKPSGKIFEPYSI